MNHKTPNRLVYALSALSLICINPALDAQSTDKAAQLSSSAKLGKTLHVELDHSAIVWKSAADLPKEALGQLRCKRDIVVASTTLERGSYDIFVSKTDDDAVELRLSPKKRKSESRGAWPMTRAASSDHQVEALSLHFASDAAGRVILHAAIGPHFASIPITAAEQLQAMLGADPAISAIDAQIEKAKIDKSFSAWRFKMTKPDVAPFAAGRKYIWNLNTNRGAIAIRLMPEHAPMHVTSTIYLTRAGFYDGLSFHRVIKKFMAQGGCPDGSGTGNCGYQYAGEFDDSVKHDRPGLLSMANAGPGTDSSQFFLTFIATPHLDGLHTIFGEVIRGMDTVRKLEADGSPSGSTKRALKIESATVSIE